MVPMGAMGSRLPNEVVPPFGKALISVMVKKM
jgi:hypothetical protein